MLIGVQKCRWGPWATVGAAVCFTACSRTLPTSADGATDQDAETWDGAVASDATTDRYRDSTSEGPSSDGPAGGDDSSQNDTQYVGVDGGRECLADAGDAAYVNEIRTCCNGAVCMGACLRSTEGGPAFCMCYGIVGGCPPWQSCCTVSLSIGGCTAPELCNSHGGGP